MSYRTPKGMKMGRLQCRHRKVVHYDGIANLKRSWTYEPQEQKQLSPPSGEHAGEIPITARFTVSKPQS